MFHGIDLHRGIRTGSQDADWTGSRRREQEAAKRTAHNPGGNMSVRSTHLGEEQDVLLLLLLQSMVPTLTLAVMSTGEEDEEKEEEEELSTYPDLYVLLHPILSLYRSFFSGFYLFFFLSVFFFSCLGIKCF